MNNNNIININREYLKKSLNIMGNSQNEYNLNDFYISFEKLIVPLEYLARHYYNFERYYLFKKKKYFDIYGNMKIEELIINIDKSFIEFEKYIKAFLNNSKYKPELLFTEMEIKGYLENIILWKQACCNKYKFYYQKLENIFVKILKKDKEMKIIKEHSDESLNNANNKKVNEDKEQNQKQLLISKQKVIQAQELALLNDNFGRALASLECYANRYSGKQLSNIFNYYDMFNLGKTQDLDELQKKAFVQTQIFNLAHEDYVRKYENYNVPENINILDIKNLVNSWMNCVPEEHKLMYQGMINIISSSNNNTFEDKFKSYTEKYKDAKMDPKKIASFAPGVFYYNQQRCEEAKNDLLEEGKITSKLNINQSYKDDKKAENLQQQILNNNKMYKEEEEYKDLK